MASVTSHSQKNKSSLSLNNHHLNNSINSEKLRNDTPQSIPLADLDGEMQISNLSLASSKSYSKSLQSIQSYNGSIKVRNIFFYTAKRKLERLQFSTSSSFIKILSACSCKFKAYFWTFWALYHLFFDLETIGVN